jgi:hypothetical protein
MAQCVLNNAAVSSGASALACNVPGHASIAMTTDDSIAWGARAARHREGAMKPENCMMHGR